MTDAPEVDPQIWFKDNAGRDCWVKVLYAAYPNDVYNLTFSLSSWLPDVLKCEGYLARVGFMDSEGLEVLYRTRGAFVKFGGIKKIHTPQ